jgi:hypothetical protein
MPTSSGKVWLKLFIVTLTPPGEVGTFPETPATVIIEGYKLAGEISLIVMREAFENELVASAGTGVDCAPVWGAQIMYRFKRNKPITAKFREILILIFIIPPFVEA